MKQCPYCSEDIHEKAIKCKHCGEFLSSFPSIAQGDLPDNARMERLMLKQRVGFKAKSELRQAVWNAPIGDATYSDALMIIALVMLLIPPFFLVASIILISEHFRQLNYWVDNGRRFQPTLLYKINTVFNCLWGIFIAIVMLIGFVIYFHAIS